jgi:hypothetical protein
VVVDKFWLRLQRIKKAKVTAQANLESVWGVNILLAAHFTAAFCIFVK